MRDRVELSKESLKGFSNLLLSGEKRGSYIKTLSDDELEDRYYAFIASLLYLFTGIKEERLPEVDLPRLERGKRIREEMRSNNPSFKFSSVSDEERKRIVKILKSALKRQIDKDFGLFNCIPASWKKLAQEKILIR